MHHISNIQNPLIMTSHEIAKLTGKELGHVHRDIRVMLDDLKKDDPDLNHPKEDKDSRDYTTCFYLSRELTETLLTGYSASARLKVIRRWHELEAKQATPVDPLQFLNDPVAMRSLLLTYTEQVIEQRKVLAIVVPKAAALDLIETADGMLNLQNAGKTLQQQPNKFVAWLRENGWIYKRAGSTRNHARAEKFNAGLLTTKLHPVILPDGTTKQVEQVMVTAKGLAKLAVVFSGVAA